MVKHEQHLRDLLAPLGVYRWEGSFQWGELRSEGMALDQAAQDLEHLQREMNLWTAQEEGLRGVLALLGRAKDEETESTDSLRQTAISLLQVGGGSFTLQAINEILQGCGFPVLVEETGAPLEVRVSFPGVVGIPGGFARIQEIVESILPCHLSVEYIFAEA